MVINENLRVQDGSDNLVQARGLHFGPVIMYCSGVWGYLPCDRIIVELIYSNTIYYERTQYSLPAAAFNLVIVALCALLAAFPSSSFVHIWYAQRSRVALRFLFLPCDKVYKKCTSSPATAKGDARAAR